ncbi:hypothetical protein PR048_005705 [Dryococelus australis]|uniref:Uncharacterized protein n=1 Tax=Dryococelus australis TaxID=614101 RepID=A0ABQ9I9H7_9NEOP|nr:hypothetical protein PR048_005705 [Dryococelus australis]
MSKQASRKYVTVIDDAMVPGIQITDIFASSDSDAENLSSQLLLTFEQQGHLSHPPVTGSEHESFAPESGKQFKYPQTHSQRMPKRNCMNEIPLPIHLVLLYPLGYCISAWDRSSHFATMAPLKIALLEDQQLLQNITAMKLVRESTVMVKHHYHEAGLDISKAFLAARCQMRYSSHVVRWTTLQSTFGRILYTGHCRYKPSMLKNPVLKQTVVNQNLDVMFFDNTYAAPECQFPSDIECLKRVVEIIRSCDASQPSCQSFPWLPGNTTGQTAWGEDDCLGKLALPQRQLARNGNSFARRVEGECVPAPSASSINVPNSRPPADRPHAYLIAYFPLTYLFRSGDIPDFRMWELCWCVGFLGDLLFPLPIYSSAAPYLPHFTPICSQDFDVKNIPNLFTHSLIIRNSLDIEYRENVLASKRIEHRENVVLTHPYFEH